MALVERLLEFKITLATGKTFAEGGSIVTLPKLRATAKISKAGTPSLGMAQIQIYGMKQSLMDQLSTLGMVFQLIPRNIVTVLAGDADSGMAVVFVGTILQAWSDYQSQPDVPFHILAQTIGADAVIAANPLSFSGSTDVADSMKKVADTMNLSFEPNGVSQKLSCPYLWGSCRAQADQIATSAGIEWFVDDTTLAIWPKGKARGGDVPIIAPPPEGKMIGYPSFAAYTMILKTEFDKTLKFGGKVQVKSSLKPANAVWAILQLDHDLSTLTPGGQWSSTIGVFNPAYPQPVQR